MVIKFSIILGWVKGIAGCCRVEKIGGLLTLCLTKWPGPFSFGFNWLFDFTNSNQNSLSSSGSRIF